MADSSRILVLRQGYFPLDPRVRRFVTTLLDAGHEVDVVCVRNAGEKLVERDGRLRIYRLPIDQYRGGKVVYIAKYLLFMVLAALIAGALHARRRYDLVEAHSLPDTHVFAAIIPKLFGAKVVLDLHELMVEFFNTKFGSAPTSRWSRLIAAAEQASIRFADHAITCTNEMRDRFAERGADPSQMTVVLNSADEELFDVDRHPPAGSDGSSFVLICHGSIEERYGIDTAIRAVAILRDEIPGLRLDIFGVGAYRDEAVALAEELELDKHVWFSEGYRPFPELLDAIAHADAGVVAMKRDDFRDLTHCNKMYDLVAMRRPVLMSRTASVEAYFDDESFEYFESDDPEALADAIRRLHADPERRERLVEHASETMEPYRWHLQRQVYLDAITKVLGKPVSRGAASDAPTPAS